MIIWRVFIWWKLCSKSVTYTRSESYVTAHHWNGFRRFKILTLHQQKKNWYIFINLTRWFYFLAFHPANRFGLVNIKALFLILKWNVFDLIVDKLTLNLDINAWLHAAFIIFINLVFIFLLQSREKYSTLLKTAFLES